MKAPRDTSPDRPVTWGELKFMFLFIFVAGFLLGVECHAFYVAYQKLKALL